MPDGLQFAALAELEHTVDAGVHGDAARIGLGDAERAELVAPDGLHLVGIGVVAAGLFPEEPVHAIADARGELQVFEERETGQADGEIVVHAVLHPVEHVAVEAELAGLERHLVLQGRTVAEGDLLVEALLADAVLPLERIEAVDVEGNVGQGETVGTVAGVLAVQEVGRERDAAPGLGPGDRGGCLVLERVAHAGGVVSVVRRAGEVDRGAEGGSRAGLGVLGMAPVHAEVLRFAEGVSAALARDVVGVVDGQGTVEGVAFLVARCQAGRPRTVGVDVAGQGQVEVVADDHGIAEVAQVEAAGFLFTVARDQDAAGTVGPLRDEAEGDDERNRHVADHGVGRAEHGALLGFGHDLGRGHLQVVVRMFGVADRVLAARDVDGLVGHHLELFADQLAFLLLRGHVLDAGLAGLEVVVHLVHLVAFAAGGHHGAPRHLVGDGVGRTFGVDNVEFGVVGHVVGLEFHVLVFGGDVAEIIDDVVLDVLHHGVAGRGEGRTVNHALGLNDEGVGGTGRRVGERRRILEFQRVAGEYQRIACGDRIADRDAGQRIGLLRPDRHASRHKQEQDGEQSQAQGSG